METVDYIARAGIEPSSAINEPGGKRRKIASDLLFSSRVVSANEMEQVLRESQTVVPFTLNNSEEWSSCVDNNSISSYGSFTCGDILRDGSYISEKFCSMFTFPQECLEMANLDALFDLTGQKSLNFASYSSQSPFMFCHLSGRNGGYSEYFFSAFGKRTHGFCLGLPGKDRLPCCVPKEGLFDVFEENQDEVAAVLSITNAEKMVMFTELLENCTKRRGLHLVVADMEAAPWLVENTALSRQLLLCQVMVALSILAEGGNFVCVLPSNLDSFSVSLLRILAENFEQVCLIRPPSFLSCTWCIVCLQLNERCPRVVSNLLRMNVEVNGNGNSPSFDVAMLSPHSEVFCRYLSVAVQRSRRLDGTLDMIIGTRTCLDSLCFLPPIVLDSTGSFFTSFVQYVLTHEGPANVATDEVVLNVDGGADLWKHPVEYVVTTRAMDKGTRLLFVHYNRMFLFQVMVNHPYTQFRSMNLECIATYNLPHPIRTSMLLRGELVENAKWKGAHRVVFLVEDMLWQELCGSVSHMDIARRRECIRSQVTGPLHKLESMNDHCPLVLLKTMFPASRGFLHLRKCVRHSVFYDPSQPVAYEVVGLVFQRRLPRYKPCPNLLWKNRNQFFTYFLACPSESANLEIMLFQRSNPLSNDGLSLEERGNSDIFVSFRETMCLDSPELYGNIVNSAQEGMYTLIPDSGPTGIEGAVVKARFDEGMRGFRMVGVVNDKYLVNSYQEVRNSVKELENHISGHIVDQKIARDESDIDGELSPL